TAGISEEAGAIRADPHAAFGVLAERFDFEAARPIRHGCPAAAFHPQQVPARRNPEISVRVLGNRSDVAQAGAIHVGPCREAPVAITGDAIDGSNPQVAATVLENSPRPVV